VSRAELEMARNARMSHIVRLARAHAIVYALANDGLDLEPHERQAAREVADQIDRLTDYWENRLECLDSRLDRLT
jgi:hypothetical protein